MDKYILLQVYAIFAMHLVAESTKYTYDYCWRDYDGTIPPDALPTNGPTKIQNSVYIGQALHEERLVPGKLFENNKELYFEKSGLEHSTDNNIKILCTQNPNKFEWIPTRHVDVGRLTDKILIKGGFEPECSTYIGRVTTAEGPTPGKVMCCKAAGDCYGLYTTYFGNGTLHFDFDILTYNENAVTASGTVSTGSEEAKPAQCRKTTINLFI